jgi:hypothetical protein
MANDVFDIKTDLSIRYYNASISSYVEIVADSYEVDIDRGIEVENGVFTEGSVGTATIKLVKSSLADFLGTPGYKANDYLDIRYRPAPDTSPSLYNYLFTGYIQNVSMGYVNESGTLQIEITVNDVMKTFLNTQLATYSITGTTTQRQYRPCMVNLATAINSSVTWPSLFPLGIDFVAAGAGGSSTVQTAFTWTNTSSGEILNRILDAELGWIWASYAPNKIQYLARTDVATLRAITYNPANATVSNVHYTNLIANGNFEVDTAGWVAGLDSPTISRNTSQFYMGVASMRVTQAVVNTNNYGVNTNTTMTVSPGDKIKGSAWIKRGSNSTTSRAVVIFYNSGGTNVGTFTGPFTTINTSGWTEVSMTGVAPATAVRAALTIQANKSFSAGADIYVDNAKLQNLTNISTTHYCLDNIVLKYDSDLLVNKVKVTETNSGTSATASNTTSITANGEQSAQYSVTYDAAASPTTLANLATRIANSATIKQVQQVTVPVIRDDGRVSSIADYDIAYTLQVEFAQDPLPALQTVQIVTRINHIITPQHWEMNIGLWRGI